MKEVIIGGNENMNAPINAVAHAKQTEQNIRLLNLSFIALMKVKTTNRPV